MGNGRIDRGLCRGLFVTLAFNVAVGGAGVEIARAADAPRPPKTPAVRILDEAERIAARVKESTYSHTTHVDESVGVYDVDCSGLLDLILERVAPRQLEHVRTRRKKGRPLALQFYEEFAESPTDAP